jgi:hypothetical protein
MPATIEMATTATALTATACRNSSRSAATITT